ncbi:hypothetical protein J23TS9_37400 [Paenibacillus sp. J23TS9]|nr:hypothetical protein J23TS9_37400 [Paenibacillus sp. J23TS9]
MIIIIVFSFLLLRNENNLAQWTTEYSLKGRVQKVLALRVQIVKKAKTHSSSGFLNMEARGGEFLSENIDNQMRFTMVQ